MRLTVCWEQQREECLYQALCPSLAGHRPGNGGRTGIVYVYARRIGWRLWRYRLRFTYEESHPSLVMSLPISITVQTVNQQRVLLQTCRHRPEDRICLCKMGGVQLTAGHKKLRVTVQRTKERVGMKSQRSHGCMFSYKWDTPSLFPPLSFCFSSARGAMSSVSLRRLIGIVRLDWKSHFAWLLSDPSPSSSLPYKYIYLRDAITTNIA
jgi:hypothetical protein